MHECFINLNIARGFELLSRAPSPILGTTGFNCYNFLPRRTPKQCLPVSRNRERDFEKF